MTATNNRPTPAEARVDHVAGLPLTARNASLADLADVLKDQHARKVDVVAPATAIRSEYGAWVIDGAEPVLTADGVTASEGRYRPTDVADEGLAGRLGIPVKYLRRLRQERPDLYDANVNGWLHGSGWTREAPGYDYGDPLPADPRSFLVRAFRGDDGQGIARALLSDRYKIVDNLDVLTAALEGVRASGAEVEVEGCDLTARRMMIRIASPDVQALAPELLRDYRSPFTGETGADNPVVSAGFVISNSETGGGAFTIVPRLRVEVCRNGMTITRDALRAIHIGGQLDEGVIRWSDDTQQKNLDLVSSQARDAVATFLDRDYVTAKIRELAEAAGRPVDKPVDTIQHVTKSLRFTEEVADGVLDHFIRGGSSTAGGVMQAFTSLARTVDDAEAAAELEAGALDALAVAAR